MAHHVEHTQSGEIPKANTKAIWRTFWILLILTAFEFLIALGIDMDSRLKAAIFIIMTFVKAFYIVGEFMHLKHEVKALIWSIVIPTGFIVWLILALLIEGNAILQVR
ncbi:MAG TPA: cytochrome C oxidase subunit IV family protein [Cytophagales bacterium]|nr:cytochrome C oxidase subunit IV family protein [Cytophagales bacterium]